MSINEEFVRGVCSVNIKENRITEEEIGDLLKVLAKIDVCYSFDSILENQVASSIISKTTSDLAWFALIRIGNTPLDEKGDLTNKGLFAIPLVFKVNGSLQVGRLWMELMAAMKK